MAQLQWDKTDFLVYFSVLPAIEDYETSFCYKVERHGLVLLVTVRPSESIIELFPTTRIHAEAAVEAAIAV